MSVEKFSYLMQSAVKLLQIKYVILGVTVSTWEILLFLAVAAILCMLIGGVLK